MPTGGRRRPAASPRPPQEQDPGTTRTLLREDDGGVVRRTVLPGGLRILTERVPGVRSVAFGVWVAAGSRDETRGQAGSAHYLEHLLFKGTQRRSALQISAAIEAVGGEMNAFTTKEYTCYYARVLDVDLPLAVDVITDLVTSAALRTEDVESERGVILEEIAMHDDDPGDAVHDELGRAVFGDTALGRSVLGDEAAIAGLAPQTIRRFYRRRYLPQAMVVAVAGSLDHARVVRAVSRAFDRAGLLGGEAVPMSPRAVPMSPRAVRRARRGALGSVRLVSRRTEQANIALGVPGITRTDPRRFALGVLNAVLGGGMSSRLFQQVREERGLAYSVYSFSAQYADAGLVGIYAGCQPGKVDAVLALCRAEVRRVVEDGISAEELARGKGQLRGALVLGQEDTGSRMSRIAKAELLYGELPSLDEMLRRIDVVTAADVADLARDVFGARPSLAVIGPFEPGRDFSAAVAP